MASGIFWQSYACFKVFLSSNCILKAFTSYHFLQLFKKPKKAAFVRRLNVEGIDRECPIEK